MTPDSPQVAPFVRVSLAPSGGLQLELPGTSPLLIIPLKPGQEALTIDRILRARVAARIALGEDGEPTLAQVRHWEQHGVFASSSCPFCISEGRCKGLSLAKRRPVRVETRGDGSAQVRTIPPRRTGKQVASDSARHKPGQLISINVNLEDF